MSLARSLKVHLRVVTVRRQTLRVVTLRPSLPAAFSTNLFHGTWHILCGPAGARLLGHLLWGLAFQRRPGTLVLIDGPHLRPTPFEADRPDPILLVPDDLTHVDDEVLRALRLRLRRASGPSTTIRWHTFGMPLDAPLPPRFWFDRDNAAHFARERMGRRAGYLCYTATAPVLRAQAVGIHAMRHNHADYYPLAVGFRGGRCCHGDGEVQVLPDFDDHVAAARVARRDEVGDARSVDEPGRRAIYARQAAGLARLRASRRGAAPLLSAPGPDAAPSRRRSRAR
jgi:hypothetical protein